MGAGRRFFFNLVYGNAVTFMIRVLLGCMFLYSGSIKALDLETFGSIIARYNMLPAHLAPYPAIVIPFLEIILGFCLVIGFRIRSASFISICLMAVFTFAISVNVIRGEAFDCGCFELSWLGIAERIGVPLLLRDIGFLLLFVLLFNVSRHLLSVDQYLDKRGLRNI